MGENRWNRILVWSCFGITAGIGILSACFPKHGFSEAENRYLQKKPEFSLEALQDGSFSTQYEAYLSDQFPAREAWVAVQSAAQRAVGKRDANGVYFGKDGYLLEKFEAEDLEGETLDKNIGYVAGFAKRMEERLGTDRVRVMLVPGASQIQKDRLPSLASPYDQSRVTDKLIAGMEEVKPGLSQSVVPVEEALVQHADEGLYYRTDHHWTTAGAYYGYRVWAGSLGITAWEREAFVENTVSSNFYGTLYAKVQTAKTPDEIILYEPREKTDYRVEYDENGKVETNLYSLKALKTKDQYAVFFGGNHGLVRMQNDSENGKAEREGRRLLLIKDSYANSAAPFLLNHFEEILMVDLRYFNADLESFIDQEGVTDALVLYRIPGFAGERTVGKLR